MKGIIWDVMGILGVGIAVAGIAFIHWQTAMIFAGSWLAVSAVIGARLTAKPRIANSTSKVADEPMEQ